MQYKVTLFRNSGFNATNIPDSPRLLINSSISRTVLNGELKSLQINQDVQLDTLTVRCTLSQARNVDFVMLDDNDEETNEKFYAVIDRHMEAEDVCSFTVQQICLLSYGGVSSLNILDGITERVHVGDDNKFYSCDGDPLLAPMEPLEMKEQWINPESNSDTSGTSPNTNKYVLAECTVDPVKTLYNEDARTVSYTNAGGDTTEVTYPALSYPDNDTEYVFGGKTIKTGTTLYLLRNSSDSVGPQPVVETRSAMANLQALGVAQGAIIRQYEFPAAYTSGIDMNAITSGAIDTMRGQAKIYNPSSLNSYVGSGHKNKLVDYSPILKFGVMSANGNSAEFELEDLRDNNDNISRDIVMFVDPRPDGRPYFRPKWIEKQNVVEDIPHRMWRNCIAGMQWKQVPLVYREASGNALNIQKFNNRNIIDYGNYRHEQNMQLANMAKGIVQGISDSANAYYDEKNDAYSANKIIQTASAGINTAIGAAQAGMSIHHNKALYEKTKLSELYDLYTSNFIVAPTVMFPYNSEAIRDIAGNGICCYQYRYTDADASRIDKLLTMYGYRVSKPLEKTDFTNRRYFNFVACKNVSVTGHSQWVNDAIARELKDGVRVWHVLPNKSYYNDNPIV